MDAGNLGGALRAIGARASRRSRPAGLKCVPQSRWSAPSTCPAPAPPLSRRNPNHEAAHCRMDRRGCLRRAGGRRLAHLCRPGVLRALGLDAADLADRRSHSRDQVRLHDPPRRHRGLQAAPPRSRHPGQGPRQACDRPAGRDDLLSRQHGSDKRAAAQGTLAAPASPGCAPRAAENIPLTKIAPGHYFVMGDCRGDSADSRVWGTLPGSLVVGRVFVIVWRFGHPYFHWF